MSKEACPEAKRLDAQRQPQLGSPSRRAALRFGGAALGAATLAACAHSGGRAPLGHVVVVGAGFGGATAARYLRIWSEGRIAVTLVEPASAFISCPLSNLVLSGRHSMATLTQAYVGLEALGIRHIVDRAIDLDPVKRELRLARGAPLHYDRVVLAPGVDFVDGGVQGYDAGAAQRMPHAWKAGAQTLLLRRHLEAMDDGGTVLISVPLAPYRCPPGPYERACQIAAFLKRSKPRSKVLILDANAEIVSKKALFASVFANEYRGFIEHRGSAAVAEVATAEMAVVLDTGERIAADVINLIPPQRAADLARDTGAINTNGRWCAVHWLTLQSTTLPLVHILGDTTQAAAAMPKSAHMANQHGKTAAAAICELMNDRPPLPPVMNNTCYSFIDDDHAVHVASVHRYDEAAGTLIPVPGAGGTSSQDREQWRLEARYAWSWARGIWADTLG